MFYIQFSLLLIVPIYIAYRSKRAGASSVFNFSVYPLIFSYFYLLVPSFMPDSDILIKLLAVSDESRSAIDSISIWTVSVFLFGYIISIDRYLKVNRIVRISALTLLIGRGLQALTFVWMIVVLIQYGPVMYAVSDDRGKTYFYYEMLMDTYKVPLVFNFAILASVVCYVNNKKITNFLPLSLFCILDLLAGGRGYLFATVMVVYLSYLTFNEAEFRKLSILLALAVAIVFSSAFFRRYISGGGDDPIHIFFGEFYATRLTAQYAFDHLNGASDTITYALYILSRLFPKILVDGFFDINSVNYAAVLNNDTGLSFGLAGSLVSEAIFFGGTEFAYVMPVLAMCTYVAMNNTGVMHRLPGYLFFVFLSAATYNVFRSSFFMIWISLIYTFTVYFGFILSSSAKKKIFYSRPR